MTKLGPLLPQTRVEETFEEKQLQETMDSTLIICMGVKQSKKIYAALKCHSLR